MKLLLIESGGKIKKLRSILGPSWNIKATMGHIVELANDGEDSLGFTLDVERKQVNCNYVPRGTRGKQILKELREAVKQASSVFLATDADREGECIGWHLAQQLHLKNPQRITYTEITEKAVRQAIAHPRPLDLNLVAAGRCRDTLDKLVGYKGSPLLWKLGNGARSMGRVQSSALHILCQREREILAFVPQDYWSVYVDYAEGFRAYYAGMVLSPDRATEVDAGDDATDSKQKQTESIRVLSQQQADQIVDRARSNPHHVIRADATTTTRKPPAPFTTSSLQQAAGSRLKYGSEKTMKVAQSLYEQGYITYMRTDSVALSEDYCLQARQWLKQHDPQNVPQRVTAQKSKAGAQEAHEAIRPTHVEYTPDSLSSKLNDEQAKLYSLIWSRAMASQCKAAQLQKTRIVTRSGEVFWQALGQVITFPGYTTYWNDLSKDSQLPIVQQQKRLTLKDAGSEQKQTQPPPRYTEPKLVQVMEKKGIGRPSTYAPTVKVLRERNYASLVKGHLQPTQLGLEVDEFLMRVLPKMVEPEFTAEMESALDDVAAGKQQWEGYLINWNETYFAPALKEAYQSLGSKASSGSRTSTGVASKGSRKGASNGVASKGSRQVVLTEIHCSKCEWLMQKISCQSEKLKADHFLKCSNQDCGTAMFWSDQKQGYELPYSKQTSTKPENRVNTAKGTQVLQTRQKTVKSSTAKSNITEHSCPVCRQPLELYEYVKENQQKQMLRCSDAQARRGDDHKNAVYFATKGVFWSPTYGEIGKQSTKPKSATPESKKGAGADPALQPTTKYPCPVCSKPLELYEYVKENHQKKMLRCSDVQARRQDDHKDAVYFVSKGVFWSPKYGEIKDNC